MVIFSTCFKTDRFSQAGRSKERERAGERERGRRGEKEMKKKKKRPTHDRRPPQICVCVPVCAMWTGCGFLCLRTAPPRALAPALMALTHSKTPNWICHTVSLESQQQLNNRKTPLQRVISSICTPQPFFMEGKQEVEDKGGGEERERERRETEREQREEQKWKHMDVFKDHQGRETCAFSHKPR